MLALWMVRRRVFVNQQPYILLVEDSPSQALRFRLVLERAGYTVFVASDGLAGWQQVCTEPPRLVLLDINLPTMDGFQVLSLIKRGPKTASVQVVMLTSQDRIEEVEQALRLGADGYLFKDDYLHGIDGVRQILTSVAQFAGLPAAA
jgi:CheY-like chemotaxis protein